MNKSDSKCTAVQTVEAAEKRKGSIFLNSSSQNASVSTEVSSNSQCTGAIKKTEKNNKEQQLKEQQLKELLNKGIAKEKRELHSNPLSTQSNKYLDKLLRKLSERKRAMKQ